MKPPSKKDILAQMVLDADDVAVHATDAVMAIREGDFDEARGAIDAAKDLLASIEMWMQEIEPEESPTPSVGSKDGG